MSVAQPIAEPQPLGAAPLTPAAEEIRPLSDQAAASRAHTTRAKLDAALRITRISPPGEAPEWTAYESLLADLLEALGWAGSIEQLLEALPHVDPIENVQTLAIILRRLGFEAEVARRKVSSLGPADFPMAYLAPSGPRLLADVDALMIPPGSEPLPSGRIEVCLVKKCRREAGAQTRKAASFLGEAFETHKDAILGAAALTALANCFALATPTFAIAVYHLALPADAMTTLLFLTALALIALATEGYLKRLRGEVIAQTAVRLHARVMREGVGKALHLPLNNLDRVSTAGQLAQFRRMENLLGFFQSGSAGAIIDAPFVVIFLLVIGIWGGWLVIVPLAAVLMFVLLAALIAPVDRVAVARSEASRQHARELVRETVANADAIRDAGVEALWLERLGEALDRDAASAGEIGEARSSTPLVGQGIIGLSAAATLGFGAYLVIEQQLSVGALLAASLLNGRVLGPIHALVQSRGQLSELREDLQMIEQMIALKDEQSDVRAPIIQRRLRGALSAQRIGYRFSEASDFALRNVSFELSAGARLAVVGPDGSGKSLLLRVATGLNPPTLGAIRLDGMPLSQLAPDEQRRAFAHAPAQPQFFYGTIAQNMRFARPDLSDTEIEELLEAIGLPMDPATFPEGLGTRLTEQRRRALSLGALQKLNIARAMLSNRPILAIDDIFPDLTPDCVRSILARLDHYRGERSILLASACRPAIEACDAILALNQGAVAAYGPKAEVLPLLTRS